jgi:hypothetical protein
MPTDTSTDVRHWASALHGSVETIIVSELLFNYADLLDAQDAVKREAVEAFVKAVHRRTSEAVGPDTWLYSEELGEAMSAELAAVRAGAV